jgi:arylsulfatase A-like enzyme
MISAGAIWLAADGARFTKFHAAGVTCCPARTGIDDWEVSRKLP